MTLEMLFLGIAALGAVISATFAIANFLRRPPSRDALIQLMRAETDILKKAGDDQARGLRQDFAGLMGNFRDGILNAFKALNEYINPQIRDFGTRLDFGVEKVQQRVEVIADKLDSDLKAMGLEANANRDALRQSIETKLEDAAVKQSTAAKESREEMNSSFRQLGERVSATLTQANDQQKERLENFSQAVATLADKNEKAHEALRQVVDAKLTSVREESLAKLDEIRQMVDEKLQATLETRLGESFARVVDQLNQMHQGIGEMKTLAASVGDLKHILTNPKIRGTFGEVQLSLLLEEFLTPDQYLTNAQVREGSSERVEFAIKMPGREGNSLLLPIDAKFPLDVYQRLNAAVEMGQPDGIADCRKQLLLRIRTCAKDIRDKYIDLLSDMPSFIRRVCSGYAPPWGVLQIRSA